MTPRTQLALLPAIAVLAAVVASSCQTSSTTETVAVSPTSAKCEITATTPGMMEATGGSGSLRITAQPECAWNASSTVTWISSIAPASAQGTADLTFRVAANEGTAARDGEIAVNDTRVRVSQRAPCRYDVSPSNQGMNAAGGAGSLTVTTSSDCAWTATSDVSWISVSQPTSGSGTATIRFNVGTNTGAERTGGIAVGNQRATITQAPPATSTPGCTYSIAPTSQSLAAAGGAGSPVAVSTQSTCRWSATSNVSWLTVTSGASGTGNGSVGFSATANPGSARTGTISIAGSTLPVSQAAASAPPPPPPPPPPTCSYSTPSKVDFGKNGGVKTFNVSTQTGCAWTAVASDSWILVVPTSGSGNATITVTVPANTTGKDRTGSIAVAGRTVSVTQDH